jgi:DNA transformation protein and related proteins
VPGHFPSDLTFDNDAVSVTDSYQQFVLEQLNRAIPPVRARRMFGGVGLYAGDVFFALIADDTVYFKTDAATQGEYEARGMTPFRPAGDKGGAMHYHQIPEDILEEPGTLRLWAEQAVAVAQRARRRSPRRKSE